MEEFSSETVEPRDTGMPFEALTEKIINKEFYIQKKIIFQKWRWNKDFSKIKKTRKNLLLGELHYKTYWKKPCRLKKNNTK